MDLIELREFLRSDKGRLLLCYLTDFMVETAAKANTNAEWVKGMGMLINHLNQVDSECRKLNELNRREKYGYN